jgi:carbonic anhydrase/acetyltransferase-like protein (isoleucine patch superfamily)
MGAIVLSRSRIGAGAIVAAGAVVPEDAEVAPGALVMGVPAREKRRLSDAEQAASVENAARYVRNSARYQREAAHLVRDPAPPLPRSGEGAGG